MKSTVLILSLSFSQLVFSSPNYHDYIYKNNASAFYDVASEQEFLSKKKEAYGKVIWNGLLPLATGISLYYAYKTLRTPLFKAPSTQAVTFGAFGFFVSQVFSGLIQNTLSPYTFEFQEPFTGFVNSCRNYFLGSQKDEVQALELQYIKIKSELDPKTQLAIESRFEKLRTNYNPQRLGISQSKEDSDLRIVKQILAIPVISRPILFDSILFSEEFSSYQGMSSTDPLLELERFSRSFALASQHTNPRLKSHLYLQGPPGVGKTEAVFKLGKALGIPVIKINLAEFSNIGQIKGIRCEFQDDSRCAPGLIASKIISNSKSGYNFKNAILFFDEPDQVLNRVQEGQSHELVSFMLDL